MRKCFLFVFVVFNLAAQKPIAISDTDSTYALVPAYTLQYVDQGGQWPFEAIIKQKFSPNTTQNFNLGYSPARFWYKFQLQNTSTEPHWLLLIEATLLDEISLYEQQPDGRYIMRQSGDNLAHSSREIDSPLFGFKLALPDGRPRNYLLAIKSNDTKQFAINITQPQLFYMGVGTYMNVYTFYFGMLLMLLLYNLLLFFSVKDLSYLYYVLYIFSFGMLQFTIVGFGNHYIWGEYPWFSNCSTGFFTGLSTIFITLFAIKFLNISRLAPKLMYLAYYLIACGIIILLGCLLPPSTTFNAFNAYISLLNTAFVLGMGMVILHKGYPPARYYMLAWGVLFLAIAVYILYTAKILTHPIFNYKILPMGALIEATVLSFALGKRINMMEKEKNTAQQQLIGQLQENEAVRNRLARDLHDDLGSTLSSVHIMSEYARKIASQNTEKLPEILYKIAQNTKNIQENLQDIVWTTQNTTHKTEDLLTRMRLFAGEICEGKNVDLEIYFDKNIGEVGLASALQYDLFMIYKEAINNALKHAQATKLYLKFYIENTQIILEIADNGQGIAATNERSGNGLANMQARAQKMAGQFDIQTAPCSGTKVVLRLHVPQ